MKNNRGEITIMMVITVIVLIILGGICIFMLTGENGIFVPKRDAETTNNTINETNTTNQNEIQEQNVIDNVNGTLTVPVE